MCQLETSSLDFESFKRSVLSVVEASSFDGEWDRRVSRLGRRLTVRRLPDVTSSGPGPSHSHIPLLDFYEFAFRPFCAMY